MGTHSDGYVEQELLTTFVTCEGDLSDPQFNTKFARLLKQLQKLLLKDPGQYLGVVKVEPWNSVRVTFTVPKDAALKLRQLAQQGDATLSQLGILSVQLEGDQAISLRIAGRVSGESQEIVLRTTSADNDSLGSESSASNADHLISKSAVVSTSGNTASLIRTMTQVLSGTSVNQSLVAFKSPNIVSPVLNTNSIPLSMSSKVSSMAIKSTTSLPHSYHSAFVNAGGASSATYSMQQQQRDISNMLDGVTEVAIATGAAVTTSSGGIMNSSSGGPTSTTVGGSSRFSVPPPPYPSMKTPTTLHLIKSNKNVADETPTTNPSPANVALSSPLLVNLLQNDGVPINSSKVVAVDKQKLKPPPHLRNAVPSSTVKRKDSTSAETVYALRQQQQQVDNATFANVNSELQVIQRIQRTSTSAEPLTMVTNVRIPVDSCNSETATVTSSKLPTMNHLTTVTANVKQNFTNQSPVVNVFQRQNVTASANVLTSQSKPSVTSSPSLLNSQLTAANRISYGQGENQVLTVGQSPKFGVRVINVQQQPQQQQMFQSQQILQKQLLQQPQQFQNQQTQILIQSSQQQSQSSQQQLIQQQKSVILQQNMQGAKVNVSTVLSSNQSIPPVGSPMSVTGNRIANQFSVGESLPQQQIPNEGKFDSVFTSGGAENNSFADDQHSTSVGNVGEKTTSYLPVSNVVISEPSVQPTKVDVGAIKNSNVGLDAIVTCAALHLVKSFTFTNPSLSSQNSLVTNNISMAGSLHQRAKLNLTSKINSVVYNAAAANSFALQEKVGNSGSIVANTVYSTSASNYLNTVVTNSNTVLSENQFDATTAALTYVTASKADNSTLMASSVAQKLFQNTMAKGVLDSASTAVYSSVASSNVTAQNQSSSTMQLPQYSRNTTGSYLLNTDSKGSADNKSANSSTFGGGGGSSTSGPSSEKEPQFLINPLTGEMEAMTNESSDNESDNQTDIFSSLPPSVANNEDSCFSFSSPITNEKSNSMYSEEEEEESGSSTLLKKSETDQSEAESSSSSSTTTTSAAVVNKSFNGDSSFTRHRILSSGAGMNTNSCSGEKIKIRLKLEKNEPVSSAYKVDVLNTSLKKLDKPTSIVKPMPRVSQSTTSSSTNTTQSSVINTVVDEPRVPPIRLSLRGKNLAFVKKNKKWSEDTKDGADDNVDKKSYFKSKMSSNEIISEKDCLSSETIDLCKSPVKICKIIDDDTDELKPKFSKNKKLSSDVTADDVSVSSQQSDSANEMSSSFNPVLSSVRTFPTEAEVTSILRSVPTDAPNKMSLSCVKIKKREGKKKLFPRDRASMLSNSALSDDTSDTFTRVINETKCSLSSQSSKGKTKSTSSSLLKSVMKSTAVKEARLMNLANRNIEKRLYTGSTPSNPSEGGTPITMAVSKGTCVTTATAMHQRRPSAEMTYTVSGAAFSNAKASQKPMTEGFVHSPSQYVPSSHSTTNNLYGSTHLKDVKKFVNNAATPLNKVANNCKSRDYQNMKSEMRKEVHLNHEGGGKKSGGHFLKKISTDALTAAVVECKQQNVVVNCLQVEPIPLPVCGVASLSTTHLDISDKVVKQSLIEENTFGEPLRKKQRVENGAAATAATGETTLKNGPILERLISLPSGKDAEVSISSSGIGGESPSGATNENTNNQGEDSGIESMDALSEKSPNQGESPCRKEEKDSSSVMNDTTNSSGGQLRENKTSVNAYCDKATSDSFSDSCSSNSSQCDRGGVRNENDSKVVDNDISNVSIPSSCSSSKILTSVVGMANCLDSSNVVNKSVLQEKEDIERTETLSPDLDDVQPFRVTPALYTYSNPEKIRVGSPSPVLEDLTDEISLSPKPIIVAEQPKTSTRLKRKRKEPNNSMYVVGTEKSKSTTGGKSLLEQLLIEIPSEATIESRRTGMSTRNTRSQLKGLSQPSPDTLSMCSTSSSSSIRTPKCSPVPRAEETPSKSSPRPSNRLTSRRSRKGSESSNVSNGEESVSFGASKRKNSENTSGETTKACIGFEDQNGKKVAVTAPASLDAFRPVIGESSSSSTTTSSSKVGASRGAVNRRVNNVNSVTGCENSTPSRAVGKKRKGAGDVGVSRKPGYTKLQSVAVPLIKVADSKEDRSSELSSSSATLRNSRATNVNAGTSKQTPSVSRRSVRQNHVTRRRKSPPPPPPLENSFVASNSTAASCATTNTSVSNVGSGNAGKSSNSLKSNANSTGISSNSNSANGNGSVTTSGSGNSDTSKSLPNDKSSLSVNTTDKAENKTVSRLNCVTKKETASLQAATCNTTSIGSGGSGGASSDVGSSNNSNNNSNGNNAATDPKTSNGTSFGTNITVTTRGNSVKQTHLTNDSAIAAPPQDISHTHTVPVSEEVINTRRKTRSVANSNVSDEHSSKRRRNSRDGK